jgi:Family of unknown function (DUF5335)
MTARHISPDSWAAELDSFSRQHDGWLVSIRTRPADGRVEVEVEDLPLRGVSTASPYANDIAITVGDFQDHLTHEVRDATSMRIDFTPDLAERALVINAKDGSMTTVEFRSPIRAEEVDGLPIR